MNKNECVFYPFHCSQWGVFCMYSCVLLLSFHLQAIIRTVAANCVSRSNCHKKWVRSMRFCVCVKFNGFVSVIFRLFFETFISFSFIFNNFQACKIGWFFSSCKCIPVQFMKKNQSIQFISILSTIIFFLFDFWISICMKLQKSWHFLLHLFLFLLKKRSINIYYY